MCQCSVAWSSLILIHFVAQSFWSEVNTLVEAGGNTLIVAPELKMECEPFDSMVQQLLAAPLGTFAGSALDVTFPDPTRP